MVDSSKNTSVPVNSPRYLSFVEIIKRRNDPAIQDYLQASAATYKLHELPFDQIQIASDHSSAHLEFRVNENMQANEGIMHGALGTYVLDSIAAALVIVRSENGHQPLTTNMNTSFLAPCRVGQWYIAEVGVIASDNRKEDFEGSIRHKETGQETVTSQIHYIKRKMRTLMK